MKQIVLMLSIPFLKKDHDRFGIDILKKSFSVKILDFTPWLYPDIYKAHLNEIYLCDEYELVDNKKTFLKLLSKIYSSIVIDRLENSNKNLNWIKQQLRINKNFFVTLNLNRLPTKEMNYLNRTKMLFGLINRPDKLIYKIYKFIERKYYNSKFYLPDMMICGGLEALNKSKARVKVNAHSMDYDLYLKIRNKKNFSNSSYAVFLDEDMSSHSDYIRNNVKPPIDRNEYYYLLAKYLKKFEKESKLPVHIAVHPKISKDKLHSLNKLLDGIKYSVGNTPELVKNSKVVLLHGSTSISFAILFNKPVIFLTSDKLKKSWIGSSIEDFSNLIGGKLLNMDDEIKKGYQISNLHKIDFKKYKYYEEQYLKIPKSQEKAIWEIFSEYILKNNFSKLKKL